MASGKKVEVGLFPHPTEDVVDAIAVPAAGQGVVPLVGEGHGGRRDGLPGIVPQGRAVDMTLAPVHIAHAAQRQLRHALHLDAEGAKDDQPEEGEGDGRDEAAEDELLDGAPARDARDEHPVGHNTLNPLKATFECRSSCFSFKRSSQARSSRVQLERERERDRDEEREKERKRERVRVGEGERESDQLAPPHHAHEGRPGDPPAPVEDGPGAHEAGAVAVVHGALAADAGRQGP